MVGGAMSSRRHCIGYLIGCKFLTQVSAVRIWDSEMIDISAEAGSTREICRRI